MSPAGVFQPAHPGRWELGEAPRWDALSRQFSWVDILQGNAFVATLLDRGLVDRRSFSSPVAVGAVERCGDTWLAAAGKAFWAAKDDFRFTQIHAVDGLERHDRANDAACDPLGRMVSGFMSSNADEGAGRVVRLTYNDGLPSSETLLTGCTIPNGLAWSADGAVMFHADSGRRVLTRYEYGDQLASPEVIAEFGADEGAADGLALDADGNIWAAMWGGAEARCYSPDGELLERLPVPVQNPTALCFGGPGLGTLFITSARYGLHEPTAIDGAVLIGSVGVSGSAKTPAAP